MPLTNYTPVLRTRKEFADLLQISYDTLKRRLDELDKPPSPRMLLTPTVQKALLDKMGFEVKERI